VKAKNIEINRRRRRRRRKNW